MINGVEYAYEDVQIVVEGKSIPLTGVLSIEYGVEKAHANLLGRGARPVAMGRGPKKPKEGTLEIYQSEFEAMQRAMPSGKDILDRAPFTISCSYAPLDGIATTDIQLGCRILEWTKKIGAEDTHQVIALKILPFEIKLGVL